MTLESLFPLIVDAVKRMHADIQNAMSLKATTAGELANLKTQHTEALSQKDVAIADRQSQIQALQAQLAQTGSDLRDQISTLEAQVDSARTELEELRTQSEASVAKLENQVSQGAGEIRTLIDREKPFASEGPDGEVLAARDGQAWVNLGKRNLLMPGTVFTVLGRRKGGALYPKGVVKVTMVDETMSRAAVMSLDSRADPIVEGDLVQSTTYSPNRQLRFYLLGEFTRMGRSQVEARLEALGAKVDDDVTTLTHYLVLGAPSSGGESLESSEAYKKAMQYGTTILTEEQLASFTSL
jgi:NAD-dependent DNA ligase